MMTGIPATMTLSGCFVLVLTFGVTTAFTPMPVTLMNQKFHLFSRHILVKGLPDDDDFAYNGFDDEDLSDQDELDVSIRQQAAWRRVRRADMKAGPIPGDEDEDYDKGEGGFRLPRFPWEAPDYRDDDDDGRKQGTKKKQTQREEAPRRKKKYSGGQELTGFWLWLRDVYDAVFWYDIDFDESPYQPRQRFYDGDARGERGGEVGGYGGVGYSGAYRRRPQSPQQAFGGGSSVKKEQPAAARSTRGSGMDEIQRQKRWQEEGDKIGKGVLDLDDDDGGGGGVDNNGGSEWVNSRGGGGRSTDATDDDVSVRQQQQRRQKFTARATPEVSWRNPGKKAVMGDGGDEFDEIDEVDDRDELKRQKARGDRADRASGGRQGRRRPPPTRSELTAGIRSLQAKMGLVEKQLTTFERRLKTVEEKLSVLKVSHRLWTKRLEELDPLQRVFSESQRRLDEINERGQKGRQVQVELQVQIEDSNQLLNEMKRRMSAMERKQVQMMPAREVKQQTAAVAGSKEDVQEELEQSSSSISTSEVVEVEAVDENDATSIIAGPGQARVEVSVEGGGDEVPFALEKSAKEETESREQWTQQGELEGAAVDEGASL